MERSCHAKKKMSIGLASKRQEAQKTVLKVRQQSVSCPIIRYLGRVFNASCGNGFSGGSSSRSL